MGKVVKLHCILPVGFILCYQHSPIKLLWPNAALLALCSIPNRSFSLWDDPLLLFSWLISFHHCSFLLLSIIGWHCMAPITSAERATWLFQFFRLQAPCRSQDHITVFLRQEVKGWIPFCELDFSFLMFCLLFCPEMDYYRFWSQEFWTSGVAMWCSRNGITAKVPAFYSPNLSLLLFDPAKFLLRDPSTRDFINWLQHFFFIWMGHFLAAAETDSKVFAAFFGCVGRCHICLLDLFSQLYPTYLDLGGILETIKSSLLLPFNTPFCTTL